MIGDAKTVAFMDRYLLVGTLVLDASGRTVELPVQTAADADGTLAGSLASVALDHLELVATTPRNADVVSIGSAIRAHLSELPDLARPRPRSPCWKDDGVSPAIAVGRRAVATPTGADLVVEPYNALEPVRALPAAHRKGARESSGRGARRRCRRPFQDRDHGDG